MPSSSHGGGGGGVRLDGSGPVLSEVEAETSQLESDASSIVSIGDRLAASDTEDGLAWEERQGLKYRFPLAEKTRLHGRTKEPLGPGPRRVRTPTTPRAGEVGRGKALPSLPSSPLPVESGDGEVGNGGESEFYPSGISRAGSIYTLSRVSFSGQLSQLTSMRLPDATSLSKRISSMPTAREAADILLDSADQIRMWISKASEVLSGLDADDDVEWAAAGGRDGVEDVDRAIERFDRLVQVYITSIERLQTRPDVAGLPVDELLSTVNQMEAIATSWQRVKQTLKGIKEQVEIAMEWQELWNTVLGEIGQEIEGLNRLVFEMEERRHEGAEALIIGKDSIDIGELETIVEERPGRGQAPASDRLSLALFTTSSPIQPTPPQDTSADDSSLLALFARMQPLRASLDFLPMRLSVFHSRGNATFPSACIDLEQRRDALEHQWKKLEADAEALRRELGEDRWVLVFRNAGKQALKMCESITRSFGKLRDAIASSEQEVDPANFAKRLENYEAKKTHYGPAIERVLAIIDRGVLDRLTVNGEILRLQSDMKRRWTSLQAEMRELDTELENLTTEQNAKKLRDSVSTVVSSQPSVASSALLDTPGSSPASSVVGASRKGSFQGSRTPTPLVHGKTRASSYSRSTGKESAIPRRAPLSRLASADTARARASPSPSPAMATKILFRQEDLPPPNNRPRWTSRARVEDKGFLPLSALEPSPYAKTPVTPKTNFLRASSKPAITTPTSLASRLPAARTVSPPSPLPRPASTATAAGAVRKSSLPVPTLSSSSRLVPRRSSPSLRPTPPSTSRSATSTRRSSVMAPSTPLTETEAEAAAGVSTDGNDGDTESPLHHKTRPPSGTGRRSASSRRSRSGRNSASAGGVHGGGGGAGNGRRGSGMMTANVPSRSKSRLEELAEPRRRWR